MAGIYGTESRKLSAELNVLPFVKPEILVQQFVTDWESQRTFTGQFDILQIIGKNNTTTVLLTIQTLALNLKYSK